MSELMRCLLVLLTLLVLGCSDNRGAKACLINVDTLGIFQERGFRYVTPEHGHCWGCKSEARHMSDSAMRVCNRVRKKGEEYVPHGEIK